jgi:hypothetical protein
MQVYLGNRRVGEAKLSPRPGQREIIMPVMDGPVFAEPGEVPAFSEVRNLVLKINKASFRVDRHSEMMHGSEYVAQIFKNHGVQLSDCEKHESYETDSTIYRYPVIQVTKDQLEEIFDFDWFEPADGPVDREYLQERHARMMNSHFGV